MASGSELKEAFWDELEDSPFVMLGLSGVAQSHAQPMTAQFDEDIPNTLFFFTGRDNSMVQALSQSHDAVVNYVAKGHDLFACVHGTLTVDQDPKTIDKFWSPMVAAWFEGGREDPSLTLMRFDAGPAEIWRSTQGDFLHYMASAITKGDASDAAKEDVKKVHF